MMFCINVSSDQLERVSRLLNQKSTHEDLNGKPFGTYLASCWNDDARIDYILEPKDAQSVLRSVAKFKIREEEKNVLDRTARYISESEDRGK